MSPVGAAEHDRIGAEVGGQAKGVPSYRILRIRLDLGQVGHDQRDAGLCDLTELVVVGLVHGPVEDLQNVGQAVHGSIGRQGQWGAVGHGVIEDRKSGHDGFVYDQFLLPGLHIRDIRVLG